MDNNTILSQELEEMRAQVAILKNKLDKQTIINDSHIRNSMKSKRSDMTRIITATIAIGALSVPYCTPLTHLCLYRLSESIHSQTELRPQVFRITVIGCNTKCMTFSVAHNVR